MASATQASYGATGTWTNLVATVTAAASTSALIQNFGPANLQVFQGGASAPVADTAGTLLKPLDQMAIDSAYVWVRSVGGNATVGVIVTTGAPTQGNVAHDAVDSGNPFKVGARAQSGAITPVADADRTDLLANRAGVLYIAASQYGGSAGGDGTNAVSAFGHRANTDLQTALTPVMVAPVVFNGSTWDRARGDTNATITRSALGSASWAYAGVTGGITNTADVALMAAGGAGVRNFLHSIQWKNTSAVASEIVVKDGSTVIWRGHVSASMAVMDGWTFDPPLRGTANTALNVAMLTTATATVVSAQGSQGT